tara:strand:- start:1546 stop:4461 length:2916 start_codon:yes stop_codon:yes gene_type:complete
MPILGESNTRQGFSNAGTYLIDNSIQFVNDDSTYLNKTFGTPTSASQFGYSFWVRLSDQYDGNYILSANGGGNNDNFYFSSQKVNIQEGGTTRLATSQLFLDQSAWYHFVVAYDLGNSTNEHKLRLYLNGTEITAFGTDTRSGLSGTSSRLNANGISHDIGANVNNGVSTHLNNFDGYVAEFVFIDGSVITPSMFGKTDANGIWIPKDPSGLTFGNNGFYLDFEVAPGTGNGAGTDVSGRTNHFTESGFGAHDQTIDTPTNNTVFPTFNGLANGGNIPLADGNKLAKGTASWRSVFATQNFGKSGKWYLEVRMHNNTSNNGFIAGIQDATDIADASEATYIGNTTSTYGLGYALYTHQNYYTNGSYVAAGQGTLATGDIISVALDLDNSRLHFAKNGSYLLSGDPAGNSGGISITSGKEWVFGVSTSSTEPYYVNFGADSTFGGAIAASANTDANSVGSFKYAPPTGFLALNTKNLTAPTITKPSSYMNTVLYTGNNTAIGSGGNAVTGVGFQPDLVWIKSRGTGSTSHIWTDSVRGPTKIINSNSSGAESTDTEALSTFGTDGFSVGNNANVNGSSDSLVAWCWAAGGASPTKTYTVKVVDDSGNKYRFDDFGTSAVTLDLQEGGTYTFNLNDSSVANHPFNIGTSADANVYGSGIVYYLDGVSVTNSAYISGFSAATTRQLVFTVPASAPTLYYFCSSHGGMGGQINTNSTHGSSNFTGSTQAVVSSNPTSGFSIIKYQGTGSSATLGHELSAAPTWVLVKDLDNSRSWNVYHQGLQGPGGGTETEVIYLDQTVDSSADSTIFGTAPTSSVVNVVSGNGSNGSSINYIMYAWAEVEGYSKFGYYRGSSSLDGAFVNTGFKPAWIMIKESTLNAASHDWFVFDTARYKANGDTTALDATFGGSLEANDSTAEEPQSSNYSEDPGLVILSNGFKLLTDSGTINNDGRDYIYMAFAETYFGGGTKLPTTNAR